MSERPLPEEQSVAELRESEARFRSLSGLSADIYWEQDAGFRFTSISASGERELEPGRSEFLLGKTRWDSDYVNLSEADWAAHRALLDAHQPFHDLELCRQDSNGRNIWISVSGAPIFSASGAFQGYRGIARNITKRKRAQELRDLEHAVTRSLAQADELATGLQSVVRTVCESEGWECGRYFRVDEEAGIMRFVEGWCRSDPTLERFLALSRDIVYRPGIGLSGRAWQTKQLLWTTNVGTDPRASQGAAKVGSREIGIHGTFVFPIISEGKTVGVLNFATRKAREPEPALLEAIAAIGTPIGQFVQQRQADERRRALEGQLRQAQKLQAIGTLATGIAHEFNNALRAILANVELARMDIGQDHPVRESIEEIDKAGRRARDFVQQILAFARPEAAHRRRTELGELAQETVKLLRAAVPANIELSVHSEGDTPAVLADATQMHQLLVNLCTNAWQAIAGNSGRIVVSLSGATLDARAASSMPGIRPGRFAHLSVSDSGTGIDAPTRERLFEPFFSTKPIGEGTGLGLAVVHGIVHAHQGAIAVQSEPGKGTTFHIYLPALPASTEPFERGQERTPGRGRHVLFLDDNPELVHAMERTLPRQGYRVSGYTAAEQALAAVRAEPQAYDLVVTDYRLPGISGLDVAREITRARPDLPIVVISGYVDDNLRRAALELGVREVLHKLHTTEELFDTIDRLTGNVLAH